MEIMVFEQNKDNYTEEEQMIIEQDLRKRTDDNMKRLGRLDI